ncbi:MAG: ribonuclease P protein component [Candidatus Endobugula sp.]
MSVFRRSQRLLNAADFSNVFSDPPFRASHQHCLILAKPNNLHCDRLGLVIAKKNVRLAVHRNRIKRIIRESFRHLPRQKQGIDAIVLARRGLGEMDSAEIRSMVEKQWLRIQKKTQSYQP